ncbi:hypothetical protein [Pontibacter beigongshangensis]|uniref:hypothetical protein n=1 Tax=Pontibacter beigongshangensis TaxID=2574733 RepID=UPI001650AE57|nr:hypothetical protein [Pontibacter beigongshangensis]
MNAIFYLRKLRHLAGQYFPLRSFGVAAAAVTCAVVVQSGQVNFVYPLELLLNDLIK